MSRTEPEPQIVSTASTSRSAGFVALAYTLTWLGWSPLALRALGAWNGPAPQWLHLVGSLGPATAAFLVVASEGRDRLRDLAVQCIRAPARWVVLGVGVPAVLFGVSAVALAIAGSAFDAAAIGRSAEFPDMPIALYVLANIVFYGFGEEIGWRGYLLPRIPGGPRSARAVLTVTLVWAGWHVPLFVFSAGMSSMGVAAAAGWLASILAGSLLTAELYAASRSVLVVALFHGTLDVFINSPVGGALQGTMGALVTIAGFTAPLWVRRFAPRDA